jgi:hypothetical protein
MEAVSNYCTTGQTLGAFQLDGHGRGLAEDWPGESVLTKLLHGVADRRTVNTIRPFESDHTHVRTPQLTNMLARTSLRQVSIAARASLARGYTSSIKEGSVASSKEFGYVSVADAPIAS